MPMQHRSSTQTFLVAALMLIVAGLAFSAPASADYSTKLADPVGDSGGAPDLVGLIVSYTGPDADALTLAVAQQPSTLPDGSDILIGFDTDRDPATGGDGGADYLLTLTPTPGGVDPTFSRWESTQYVPFQPAEPVLSGSKDGAELIGLCLCDLKNPTDFGIFARSEGNGATDLLPDSGTSEVALPVLAGIRYAVNQPVAGRRFQVLVRGVHLLANPQAVQTPQSVTCSATLAGKRLALTGHCLWRIPVTAHGQKLMLSIAAGYAGTKATFTHTFTVR